MSAINDSIGRKVSDPLLRNAAAAAELTLHHRIGNISIAEMADALEDVVKFARSASAVYAERVLLSQVNTLDVIFTGLASRAATEVSHDPRAVEMMRLALKAQNQCRATLESMASIKNPSAVLFTRQANFAGHQQINNGQGQSMARVEVANPPNELLESENGKRMDA